MSHSSGAEAPPLHWGAASPAERGPVIGTTSERAHRNVIGTHSGSWHSVYRALRSRRRTVPAHRADLTNTARRRMSSGLIRSGVKPESDRQPRPWAPWSPTRSRRNCRRATTSAPPSRVTKAHVMLPEIADAIAKGRLRPDGRVLLPSGAALVTKAAVEPVWHLPGSRSDSGAARGILRRVLFEETGGMYPELVTRSDLKSSCPDRGQTLYIFGDARDLADPAVELTARVHDECNGSDVFGSTSAHAGRI